MNIVTVDFETFWDADYTLRKLSTSEYIRDKRFKVQCVSIKEGAAPAKVFPTKEAKKALTRIDWKTSGVVCHNTPFDGFILSHHFGIVPAYYYDTLAMARALHSNQIGAGLDEVARFYGKGSKHADVLGKSKGLRDLPPAVYDQLAMYCAQDVELCYEIFLEMSKGFPQSELDLIDITCRMFCDPVLKVDLPRVEKELVSEIERQRALMLTLVNADDYPDTLSAVEAGFGLVRKDAELARLLTEQGVEPPQKWSPKQQKVVYAFAKTDLDFTELLHHDNPRVQELVDARLEGKSTLGTTRAERFLKAGGKNYCLPVLLNYYGAHTGRFSGGNKMNLQNLPRGGELRKSILAPTGQMIVVADSGQIEARVTAWLAGQEDLVQSFRDKRDVYCEFASTVFGRLITPKDVMERHVGKTAILGLGYGMGGTKFQRTLKTGFIPVEFSEDQCTKIVKAYRSKYSHIQKLWWKMESIMTDMLLDRVGAYKCLNYEQGAIWMPNGLAVKYPMMEAEWDDTREKYTNFTYQARQFRNHIYGGKATENIVQALARIIVTDQMLAAAQKYRVVMMTHDEIAVVVQKKDAKKCADHMLEVMSTPPAWCADLPVTAEVKFAEYYCK